MRALYYPHYEARMRVLAEQVPAGSSVVELCCGPGTLYRRYLRRRVSGYVGLDLNELFVRRLRESGVQARVCDLAAVPPPALPAADVVLMQASLYHFLPDAAAVLERMLSAAGDCVIIAEPVRNLASSELPLVGALGRRAADPGVGGHARRFDAASLEALMSTYSVRRVLEIPGGREHVYVLDAA